MDDRNAWRTQQDCVVLAGSHHSQDELEYRARRMCAIAGIDAPRHWPTGNAFEV